MSVYDLITARVVSLLEAGVAPWRKPWGGSRLWPRNLVSGHHYRGINVFLLACSGYSSPFWLTYKQAQAMGGHVRKGEKASPIVFWTKIEKTDRDSGKPIELPVLRYYSGFNVAQCEGLPEKRIPVPTVPAHVHQGNLLRCWAASTESWLGAQPHRTHYTQEQIVKGMQDDGFARADGSLPVSNQAVWEDRVGLRPIKETGSSFFAERILARLELEKRPLLLGLGDSLGHVVVVFGVVVNGFDLEIMVMDPMLSPADHPGRRKVTDIQRLSGNVVTWMHKMPLMI
jgi:N-terminal domain of anti-restriction factor ArdC